VGGWAVAEEIGAGVDDDPGLAAGPGMADATVGVADWNGLGPGSCLAWPAATLGSAEPQETSSNESAPQSASLFTLNQMPRALGS